MPREEVAQRGISRGRDACAMQIEAQDVRDHAQERGVGEVAPLREQRVDGGAVVLEPGARAAHREAHAGGLRRHLQLVHERGKAWICPVVEDDEAHVHGPDAAAAFHVTRERVAAHVLAGFEHREVVLPVQPVRRG